MKKIAVFIDRDGTINEETGYVDSLDKFHILPGVTEAIRRLNDSGIPAIMITNQSGLGRGYFSRDFLDTLHNGMMMEFTKQGCRLDGIYICPHHPDENCACRKPRPGMILKAAKEKGIALHASYVVGDKIIDVELAHRVGAKGILVLTGYGAEELKTLSEKTADSPDHVAANLYKAVEWVLKDVAGSGAKTQSQETLHSRHVAEATPTTEVRRQESPSLIPSPLVGEGKGGGGEFNRRILIVKPSSLGDIIHSLPVLWELRRLYPEAHIGWVVKDVWRDIIADNPLLDEVIVLKKGVRGFLSAVQDIRKTDYDTVIDLQGLFRSGLMTILSGASERIGFSNARELAYLSYNHKVAALPGTIHAVDRYLLTIETLMSRGLTREHENPPPLMGGGEGEGDQRVLAPLPLVPSYEGRGNKEGGLRGIGGTCFPLYIDIEDAEWVKGFMTENNLSHARPLIAINPSARWEKKRWPISSYAALINQLIQELKAGIIILGGKEDIPIAEEISFLVSGRPAVAAGKTSLKTLTALLERVDLLVTNDSGPMHIAAALRTPVVALFGPTNPGLTGPYGDGHIVIRKEMECSPCLRRPCLHGRPLCMEAIKVEEVMEAVKSKMNYPAAETAGYQTRISPPLTGGD